MRPWAERLLDLVRAQPGERCLDLLSESDVLARLLRRAVGPAGTVDVQLDRLRPAASAPRWSVGVSLFGLGAAEDALDRLASLRDRLQPGGGRLAAAVWAGAAGAPHEAAVHAGLADVGVAWPDQAAEFRLGEPGALDRLPAGLRAARLRDVVRFDGIAHLWAALVDERAPGSPLGAASADALSEARRVCSTRLARYAAADGTLRIPVEAVVVGRAGRTP